MYVPRQISTFRHLDRVSFKPGKPGSRMRLGIRIVLNPLHPVRIFQRLCRPVQQSAEIRARSRHR